MLRKKSIIIEWGISYALILVIPLITIFINYGYNTKIIQKEIIQAHELILDNLKDNIDLLFEEEWKMFSNFYFNEEVNNLIYAQEMDANFYFDARTFKSQLAAYSSVRNEKMSYWLYIEDKDYIINSMGGHRSLNIYNSQKLLGAEMPTYEDWMNFLRGDFVNEFLFYDGLYTTKSNNNLVYANSYSYLNNVGKVNVFISIPISVIESMVTSLPEGSLLAVCLDSEEENMRSQLLVIDSKGITEIPNNVTMNDLNDSHGIFEVADYMGISVRSANQKATYALLIPQEIFWRDSSYIRNVHLISFLITIVIGICLVIFLVKRNFKPVSGILAVVGNEKENINEFDQIKDACYMMWQENTIMKKSIASQEKAMISSYLLALLKGRVKKISDSEQQTGLGLLFQNGTFALIGIYVQYKKDQSMEDDELSFFVVDNIFSELMQEENFYKVEDGRFIYYLFCIPNGHEDTWKVEALRHAKFLCDLIDEKFDMLITVAISEVEQDIGQAKYMYQSVMEAFEYKKIIGGNGVITTKELEEPDENNQLHVCHVMLEKALEKGNVEAAYLASAQLFHESESMSFIALRLRVLEAFLVVVDSYNRYIADSVKRMQLLPWLEQLLNAEERELIEQKFNEVLAFVCTKINGQWEVESKSLVKTVQEYVEVNYADSNLNISSIAENMNRNSKYVSKVYKDETGEGILDYINILRIRKAQELLLTKNVSVDQVSVLVGYASTRTFRRSFVKIVGMTPSEYLERN